MKVCYLLFSARWGAVSPRRYKVRAAKKMKSSVALKIFSSCGPIMWHQHISGAFGLKMWEQMGLVFKMIHSLRKKKKDWTVLTWKLSLVCRAVKKKESECLEFFLCSLCSKNKLIHWKGTEFHDEIVLSFSSDLMQLRLFLVGLSLSFRTEWGSNVL